jgi:hypothetical protein
VQGLNRGDPEWDKSFGLVSFSDNCGAQCYRQDRSSHMDAGLLEKQLGILSIAQKRLLTNRKLQLIENL